MANVTTQCRDLNELKPVAKKACTLFLNECNNRGIGIFITETYRSQERQNHLYAQGRTRPGNIVTWTKSSNHTGRLAWDIACYGNELYDTWTLERAGQVAKELGITWGGLWRTPDRPHFEVAANWREPKKEAVKLTYEEALKVIKEKCKFDDNTMLYLQMYRYGESMVIRIAEQMR